jgi:hypothetical protein
MAGRWVAVNPKRKTPSEAYKLKEDQMSTRILEISNSDDLIDVRDAIARVEELEGELDDAHEDSEAFSEILELRTELTALTTLLADLCGNGGDEQWRGNWYPITLIRDSYFEDLAQELAANIGAINKDLSWPNNCIDWERAARELQSDYTSVSYEGVTYWYR